MAVVAANATYDAAARTLDTTMVAAMDLATAAGAGTVPGSGVDYQVKRGYIDFSELNLSATLPATIYILEYLLEPSETDSTTGLQDATFIFKKFMKKQMLGISTYTIPALWSKVIRLPLSQATVLGASGYKYIIRMYSGQTMAVNTLESRTIGGKFLWDRVV